MRGWIGVGALLVFGLLTGCGGESSPPQTGPKPTEQVIDKEGNVTERRPFPGPDWAKKKDTRGTSGPDAKK